MRKITVFCLLILFCFGTSVSAVAQRKTKLNTHGQGTFFAQIGYNRSVYSNSDVEVTANNYRYTLEKVKINDTKNGQKLGSFFSNPTSKISAKVGYFIRNNWALTLSFDRYNTYFETGQNVRLNGIFPTNDFPPFTNNFDQEITLNTQKINLAQEKGMNYFSIGLQRNDMLGRTKRAEFGLHVLYGIKFGGLFTKANYTFYTSENKEIPSLSGWGSHAELGVRLDFYQIIFLQLGINGGVLYQNNIKISHNENEIARQVTGFLSPHLSIGFSIFANSKNNCASCPQW